MNELITGLAMFALGLGAVILILIWHNDRIQRIRQNFEVKSCTRPFPHMCRVNGPCNGWTNDVPND